MPSMKMLKKKISDSGMTVTAVCKNVGISRETFYNRLSGKGEFTASEIVAFTEVLHLSKKEREEIFLSIK